MIKFSRSSWHGFILDKLSPYETDNVRTVCQQVRRLLITIFILWPLIVTTTSCIAAWVIGSLVVDLRILFGNLNWDRTLWWYNSVCVFNVFAIVVIGMFGWAFLRIQWEDFRSHQDYYTLRNEEPTPSLIKEYFKGIKEKICPLVRYDD